MPGEGGHDESGYACRRDKADDQRQDQRPDPVARVRFLSRWRRLTVPIVKRGGPLGGGVGGDAGMLFEVAGLLEWLAGAASSWLSPVGT